MSRNTSISLGEHFDDFISRRIADGRYNNASEVIRAGLRLLEEEEIKFIALRKAIDEGLESGVADAFDPRAHLALLRSTRPSDG
jgi:antitoxin ParD1/3/4